uniref:Uncharacterized protein n=1 Tax=viral metagenome TaxID=1070528 RepID=A0A6M3M6B5_9ZZZZ
MILDDTIKLLQDLGARKVLGKELRSIHGIYAYMMVMEEIKTPEINGRKTLTAINQRFITIGVYQESGHLLVERATWTIANIENIPIIIVIYGYIEPQIRVYHPDEVLTKHRDNTGDLFGVIGIEFPLNLGEKIDSLEGLREKWLKKVESWTVAKKDYSGRKFQKKIKEYQGSATSIDSSTHSRMPP